MAWALTTNELVRQIQKMYLFFLETTSPFSTTTATAAIVKGDTTFTATSATGIDDTEYGILNGTGGPEVFQVSGAPAGAVVTVDRPLGRPQAIGATVKQVKRQDLGYIEVSGIQIGFQRTVTPVEAANSETPLVFIESPLQITGTWQMLTFNLLQLLAAQGLVIAESGLATAASPRLIVIGPESQKEAILVFRGEGILFDGQKFEVDFLDARMQSSGTITVGRQNAATVPFSLQCSALLARMWTP